MAQRLGLIAAVCLIAASVPTLAAAGGRGCDADGVCSGHGRCFEEREEPLCLCDEGYAAVEGSCVRVGRQSDREALWRRRVPGVGQRLVEIATTQVDAGPRLVGQELEEYPGALSNYIVRGELWCTDFVAWLFRVAGVPFTGGREGGWLVKNNFALKEWYDRHDLWVDHDSPTWETFQPEAGDYVRIHTRSGYGHSGIVRFVDGDTLHTIEGNVGNRVRFRRHRDFRKNRRIDGFGLLRPRSLRVAAR